MRRTLVVQELFSRLGGVFGVGALDNGVDGAGLLAEAAVDALGHVNVIAGGTAGAIGTLLGFDGNGLGGANLQREIMLENEWLRANWRGGITYSFAELAGNAALFSGGVSAEGVLATESGGDGTLNRCVNDGSIRISYSRA